MRKWFNSGTPWIWLNAGAVTISLVMVLGLLGLIAVRGLSHFWPATVYEITYDHPDQGIVQVIGELSRSETQTATRIREAGHYVPEELDLVERHLFKQGNRDLTGRDFLWYLDFRIKDWQIPKDLMVLERMEWGNFYGRLINVKERGEIVASGEEAWGELQERLKRSLALAAQMNHLERYDIGSINFRIEQVRLDQRRLVL